MVFDMFTEFKVLTLAEYRIRKNQVNLGAVQNAPQILNEGWEFEMLTQSLTH